MGWQDDLARQAQTIQGQGNDLESQMRFVANESGGRADYYRQLADTFYNDLVNGQGYTPEEAQRIMQSEQFQSLLFSEADEQGAYLNQDEINEIRGNPYAGKNVYDSTDIFNAAGDGSRNQRNNWLVNSGRVDDAAGGLRRDLYGAIDPRAELDPGYSSRGRGYIDGATGRRIGTLEGGFDAAQDLGEDIQLSDRYIDAATVGDDEVQGLQDQAARQIRAQNARTIQDVQMRALQGGNANALAVGALQDRVMREGALDEADAAANAMLKGLDYRRGWEDTMEGKRLGAAESRAGVGSQGLQFLRDQSDVYGEDMNANLNLNQTAEEMRQRQLNELRGARMAAGSEAGQADMTAANSNRAGSADIERETAGRNLGITQDDLNARVGLEERGEDRANSRAQQIMLNRQATQQGNAQNRFARNAAVYGQQSDAAGRVANTRREDQQTGAGYLANQNQFNARRQDDAQGRQLDAFGRTVTGVNNANQTYAAAKSQPGTWSRIASAVIGGAGALGGLGFKPFGSSNSGKAAGS